jgi:hypothetical protein
VFSAGLPDLTALFDVSIGERVVDAARDSPLQRFVYSPRLWASTLAALAVFLLVSTAFATGTVRPTPPPVPTVLPGEPTPTPDLRPKLSLGGLLLVAPESPATPTPVPSAPEVLGARTDDGVAEDEAPTETPPPPEPGCANPLGLLCGSSPPPPPPPAPAPARRTQPVRAPAPAGPQCNNLFGVGCPSSGGSPPPPDSPVIPVASPGASQPRSGSDLDAALQAASIADQRFERGVTLHALSQPTPGHASP